MEGYKTKPSLLEELPKLDSKTRSRLFQAYNILKRKVWDGAGIIDIWEFIYFYLVGRYFGHGDILETGTGVGSSAIAFALGIKDGKREEKVHTIDLFSSKEIEEEFRKNVSKIGLEEQIVSHKEDSRRALITLRTERPLRLLFLDGGHDYETVLSDLRLGAPLVQEGGLVILHDVFHSDYKEIEKAVLEYLEEGRLLPIGSLVYSLFCFKRRETIKARLEETLPGSHGLECYYPELGWREYVETLRQLEENPNIKGEELALYTPWKRLCLARYSFIPGEETPLEKGGFFSWSRVEAKMRSLLGRHNDGSIWNEKLEGENMAVSIERNGKLIVRQGNKRIALLHYLRKEKEEREFEVVSRNPSWNKVYKTLLELGNGKKELYQPVEHPDFRDWKVAQPSYERLEMIKKRMPGNVPYRVLDLGCNTGFFSRALSNHGAEVSGVDNDPRNIFVAIALNEYFSLSRSPIYFISDSYDFLKRKREYDHALYLSLIMHTFSQKGIERGWEEFSLLSERSKGVFLDLAFGGYSKYYPFTPESFPEEFLKHTAYEKYLLLGRTEFENRPLYHFWRE